MSQLLHRGVTRILGIPLLAATALAQSAPADRIEEVKTAIRALVLDLNRAFQQRDRAALEQIYAEEFVWVHASGLVDDRKAHLDGAFSMEAASSAVPLPSFDPPNQLLLYGDVAVFRGRTNSPRAGALWNTTVYGKKGGRWRIVQIQGTTIPPDPVTVKLETATLDRCVGKYARDTGVVTVITRDGDTLVVKHPGYPSRVLQATSETQFVDKLGSQWTFERGPDGKVTQYVMKPRSGAEARSKKVE